MLHTEPKPPKYPHGSRVAPPLMTVVTASRVKVLYFCIHGQASTYRLLQLLLFVSVSHTLMTSPQFPMLETLVWLSDFFVQLNSLMMGQGGRNM
jgi:hypothetical protein